MLRLRTFGGLTLEKDGVRLDEIVAQRKVLALLAVLARSGQAGIGRERLMALLWTDSDMDRARGSAKQMLHTLRRQLHPDVVTGTSELRLNGGVVSSDVADFSDSLAKGEFDEAVQHYRGPFLDGVHIEHAPDFSRWVDAERAELQRAYIDALESLAHSAERQGQYEGAVTWWLRCLAVDPLRSRGVLGVMRALDLAGDRAGALRHAQIHEDLLRDELGALPDGEVTALAADMRASPVSGRTVAQARTNENVVESSGEMADVKSAETRHGRSSPQRGGRWIVPSALAVILLAAALIPGSRNRPDAATKSAGKRTVVAMFANQTGDSTLNALQLLAADWVTRGVASTPGVDMLFPGVLYTQGRTESGTPTNALELARNNGAQLAIGGSFYRSRDTLFFAASLIDVPTGRVLRALGPFPAKSSAPLEGIEKLRQGASVAIESMLDARVSNFVSATASLPRMDAYREFLIGEELHWRSDMANALIHFEKAGQLDSSFLFVAARMAVTASNAARCDIVDSISAVTAKRVPAPSESEKLFISSSVARCNGDMEALLRIGRERLVIEPRQPLFKWLHAGALRRANRPAEAVTILETFDVDHDLGWLAGPRKLFYWRELMNAQHAVGDYKAEWRGADLFAQSSPGPLMGYYYKARSFAGRNDARSAVRMIDSIQGVPAGPIITGDSNRYRPIRAASTGWTMYGASEELLAHGHPAEARAVAEQTIRWVAGRTEDEKKEPEYRLILARALMMTGGYEQAYNVLAALVSGDSGNIEYRSGLGRAAALRGDTAGARRISLSLLPVPGQRDVAGVFGQNGMSARIYGRAQIAVALGDTAGALALLESLPGRVHPTDFLLLHTDPAFASLHNHPRFKAFIRPRG